MISARTVKVALCSAGRQLPISVEPVPILNRASVRASQAFARLTGRCELRDHGKDLDALMKDDWQRRYQSNVAQQLTVDGIPTVWIGA